MSDYGQLISLRRRFIIEFEGKTKYSCNSLAVKGLFNKLMRKAPDYVKHTPSEFLSWFMGMTVSDFIDVPQMGPKSIRNALDIQRWIRETPGLKEKLLNGCTDLILREEM